MYARGDVVAALCAGVVVVLVMRLIYVFGTWIDAEGRRAGKS